MEETKRLLEELKEKTLELKEASKFGEISFEVNRDGYKTKIKTIKDMIELEFIIENGPSFKYKGDFDGFTEAYENFCNSFSNKDDLDFRKEYERHVDFRMKSIYGEALNLFMLSPTEGFVTDLMWVCAKTMDRLRNYEGHIKYHGKWGISLLNNAPYHIDEKSYNVEKYRIVPMFRNEEDAKIAHDILKPYIKEVYGK